MKLHSQMDPNVERKQQYCFDENGELVLDDEGRPKLARAPTRLTPEQEKFKVLGIDQPPKDPDDEDEEERTPEEEEQQRESDNAAQLAAMHSPEAAAEQAKYPPNTEPEPDANEPDSP